MKMKIRHLFSGIKNRLILPVLYHVVVVFPVNRKKIVFDNFCGRGYGCNPKYIAEALRNSGKKLDLVWLVNDLSQELPKGIRKVRYHSLRSAYELATAKVWVDNVRSAFRIHKKKSQFYIQTWHSSVGLKMAEKEIEDTLSKEYIKAAKHDGKIADIMISDGPYRTNRYYNFYWYEGPVLECGLPRFDILVRPNEEVREKVYNMLKIPKSKKIILYAPTFRNRTNTDHDISVYQFDFQSCRERIEKKFGGEYVVLLRLHPNIRKHADLFPYSDTVINASDYPDMQELLAFADVLITDYSSCMFEAMYVHHKVFLYAKDLIEYRKNERKLLFSFEELPCSMATTQNELDDIIDQFDEDQYIKFCNEFFDGLGVFEPGDSSQKVANLIFEKCGVN